MTQATQTSKTTQADKAQGNGQVGDGPLQFRKAEAPARKTSKGEVSALVRQLVDALRSSWDERGDTNKGTGRAFDVPTAKVNRFKTMIRQAAELLDEEIGKDGLHIGTSIDSTETKDGKSTINFCAQKKRDYNRVN